MISQKAVREVRKEVALRGFSQQAEKDSAILIVEEDVRTPGCRAA